ncbi:MgtC/SapB family protein [Azotobacter beijerinckii]|uniref:MgtC/SapB family protein n=1 Tax=Azotobacter beijerinckii TaxID=170623 RepID=UPI002954BA23|nr:MgtC/SapB family protein [Azotobacter beijerinckii]MDV7212615.1 MgtC/SapB family protein [Azotobacter beijerinckii]
MPSNLDVLLDLAVALAVGLLIGTERGWSARDIDDSHLAAGIRTFGLTGLLGGMAALFGEQLGLAAWIVLLLVFGLLLVAGYIGDLYRTGEQGMTSEIAMLLTFLLGSMAQTEEHQVLAAAGAVVVALLLSLKDVLHNMLRRLTANELFGALKLLFISVVLLPVLPNRGYGPWQAFNPYATWWMVVLIAAIGFAAYMATRLVGARHGLLLTALLGGMVSSTAMTLTLSRLHRDARLHHLLACGLLATSALMFPRVLLEVGLINPALLSGLLWPMGAATLVYVGGALLHYRGSGREPVEGGEPLLRNPCELGPALRFAALLVLILFLVEAGQRWLGDAGVYLVALLAGLSDVDAITLSLARNAQNGLAEQVAVRGIFLAALSNSLVKGILIAMIGGSRLARLTLPVMAAGLLGGLATLWLL